MNRVLTVAEVLALPPLTPEERAERRKIVSAIAAGVRRSNEEFLARGGVPMTEEEWEEFWYSLDADDLDDLDASSK